VHGWLDLNGRIGPPRREGARGMPFRGCVVSARDADGDVRGGARWSQVLRPAFAALRPATAGRRGKRGWVLASHSPMLARRVP